ASLAQLWKMFQTAFKTGDFKSLEDGLKDFQEGRNPIERIESAKKAYEQKVEGIKDTGELIDLYNEPYGQKATELFTEKTDKGEVSVPYRIKLKEVIEERFKRDLDIDISEMKTVSSAKTVIDCAKGPDFYKITLERSEGKTLVSMDQIKTRPEPESGEYSEAKVPRTAVKNTTGEGTDSLSYVLFQKKTAPETGSEKAEQKPEVPEGATHTLTTQDKPTAYLKVENGKVYTWKDVNGEMTWKENTKSGITTAEQVATALSTGGRRVTAAPIPPTAVA
ncbi:hypothetical protein KJ657_01145, partial [Patescibacteria group bacterium]|nr:hypothetical protein [Patescibacteria group bacterium]